MTENNQKPLPKIHWKGKDYDQEKLTDQQKYCFAQCFDIQKKEDQTKFVLDQILAMKEVFEKRLEEEINK